MESFGEEAEAPGDRPLSGVQSRGAGGVGGEGATETLVPSTQEALDPVEAVSGKLGVLAGAVQHLESELLPYMKGAIEECKAATAAASAAWKEQQERAESLARAREHAETRATQLSHMMHQITAIAGAKGSPAAHGPGRDGAVLGGESVGPPRGPAAAEGRSAGDLLTLKRAQPTPALGQAPCGDGDRASKAAQSPSQHESTGVEPARKQLRLIFGGGPPRAADTSSGDDGSQ